MSPVNAVKMPVKTPGAAGLFRSIVVNHPTLRKTIHVADAVSPALAAAAIMVMRPLDIVVIALVMAFSKLTTQALEGRLRVSETERWEREAALQASLQLKVENVDLRRKNRIGASEADKASGKLKLEKQALAYKLEKKKETAEKATLNDKLVEFLKVHYDRYSYDAVLTNSLVVKGRMSEAERNELVGCYSSPADQAAIFRLFERSNGVISERGVLLNDKLVEFLKAHQDRYRYDDAAKVLMIVNKGVMSEGERNELLGVCQSQTAKAAVIRLFERSQEFRPEQMYFKDGTCCFEETLGAGGAAIVLKIWNSTHVKKQWTQMALKTLHPKEFLNPKLRSDNQKERVSAENGLKEASERLQEREALAMSVLNHPNIVQFYGSDEMSREDYLRVLEEAGFEQYKDLRANPSLLPERVPYVLMEIVPGQSLDEMIKYGRLPMDEVVDIGLKMARTMQFINEEKKVIHRDMKPGNVMVAPIPETAGEYSIKIMDFGLARLEVTETPGQPRNEGSKMKNTEVHTIMGTPQYLAPETFTGVQNVDKLSDEYAVGVILYELLTGASPHIQDFETDANDEMVQGDIARRILSGEIVDIRERLPEIPEELAQVVEKAMALKKEDRYPQWELVISALEAAKKALPAESIHELASAEVAGSVDFVSE